MTQTKCHDVCLIGTFITLCWHLPRSRQLVQALTRAIGTKERERTRRGGGGGGGGGGGLGKELPNHERSGWLETMHFVLRRQTACTQLASILTVTFLFFIQITASSVMHMLPIMDLFEMEMVLQP